ncbi:hypothetical protein, partial [Mycobacterium sp.]|uniref:hypothetical protein n=1 Tax=Mycobacterium sp. TaxID=1785 RepID=UPI003C795AFB
MPLSSAHQTSVVPTSAAAQGFPMRAFVSRPLQERQVRRVEVPRVPALRHRPWGPLQGRPAPPGVPRVPA